MIVRASTGHHASGMAIGTAIVGDGSADTRVAARDDARLRKLIDLHFDFSWRCLRRLGVHAAAADDAAQQLWLVVARRLGDIEHGRERGFIFSTAVHVAADVRRARRRDHALPVGDLGEEIADVPGPDELLDQRRSRELLDDILAAMPIELRAVFVLFELEETAVPEIARVLQIPVGTAASRLRRAREEFHSMVTRIRARRAHGGLR